MKDNSWLDTTTNCSWKDRAIFEFNVDFFAREDVEKLTRGECESYAELDSDNVRKFIINDNATLESRLNGGGWCTCDFDTENNWYRVFML